MRRALLSLCLTGAVVFAPTVLGFTPAQNLHGSDVISIAEMVALQSEEDEVHSVIVDMPQVISLAYASPETWGSLPTSVRQYEEPPATPTLQLAPYEQPPAKTTLRLAMNPKIENSN